MTTDPTDGRSTRWDAHREERHAALVEAAVAAIDEHGADASMAQIAAVAGVTKPVLYRYFATREDLVHAVGRWGADRILAAIAPAFGEPVSVRDRIRLAVDRYLGSVEEHPQVFAMLVQQRGSGPEDDALRLGKQAISDALATLMRESFAHLGLDTSGVGVWSLSVVGMGLAVAQDWIEHPEVGREHLATHFADLIWFAFQGIATEGGRGLEDLSRSS